MSEPQRIAVVGSGFGGLAAAIRLQALGHEVTIFEGRDKPGGRAYVYEIGDFRFDGGPTVITAPDCLRELFTVAGRRMEDYVELLPVQPLYRLLWSDGTRMEYTGENDSMLEQIRQRFPGDEQGYLDFVEYSRKVFQKGYTELAAVPFLNFSDMVRVAPDLVKLRADRSVYSTVARFVKHEHLREALSFHSLLVGGNPFETSAIYTLIHYLERNWGVFFPKGGTGALIGGLVKLFEEIGGRLELDAPVENIRLERGAAVRHHVAARGREEEAFDLVVSNADVHHTYAKLYGQEPHARRKARRLARMQWSMSLFVLYFGTDRSYRGELAHHSILFGPRYRGLLRDIFHGRELPEDFSLYLHAPTATDPSMAPAGKDAFYVLSPVPHLGKADLDWSKVGPVYAERILEALEEHMPDLRQHVEVQHWIGPDHFKDTLNSHHGSAFSCAPILRQSAWFRPHNRDAKLPGLHIVGAGTHPGAGIPGVVNSAKATAALIEESHPVEARRSPAQPRKAQSRQEPPAESVQEASA